MGDINEQNAGENKDEEGEEKKTSKTGGGVLA